MAGEWIMKDFELHATAYIGLTGFHYTEIVGHYLQSGGYSVLEFGSLLCYMALAAAAYRHYWV